jgi:NitT/TauT family transport system substrate-binding protein
MARTRKFGTGLDRRTFLKAAAAFGAASTFVTMEARGQDRPKLTVQYDWLLGNGQMGDLIALQNGYFKDEGLDVTLSPGGPNAQTVPAVLSGQAQGGQLGSTSQLLTAIAAGRPLRLFASGYRFSPYAYISLPKNPIREPKDFVGKTIAMNPNGRFLLDLILVRHSIDPAQVKIVTMGTDMSPLLSGQVDAVTAFLTNTKALEVLGPDIVTLTGTQAGVPSYANSYFASAESFDANKDVLTRFLRAVSKAWGWSYENRKAAVDIMCDANPALDREVEYKTVDMVMSIAFDDETKTNGWGWHGREKLETQLDQFEAAGAFPNGKPVLDDCVSWDILEATAGVRPKLG